MATRADEPLITGQEETERLRVDIVETRNHMAKTVDAIEERLSPKHMKEQVSSVKEHLLGEVSDVKAHLLGELADAKQRIKGGVTSEIAETKEKVRQATVGRVENMISDARDTFIDAGSSTLDTVRTNPIPAALVAIGVGWLLVSSMRSGGGRRRTVDNRIRATFRYGDEGYDDAYGPHEASTYGEHGFVDNVREAPRRIAQRGRRIASDLGNTAATVGHEVADRAKGVGETVGTAVTGAVGTVTDTAEHLATDAERAAYRTKRRAAMLARDARTTGGRVVRRAGSQARRYEQSFERGLRENPLAFGAVAVAVGAAIGLLLPHTELEDRAIGEKKDQLFDVAKDRVKDIAQQAISTVQEKGGAMAEKIGGGTEAPQNGVSKHS